MKFHQIIRHPPILRGANIYSGVKLGVSLGKTAQMYVILACAALIGSCSK